MTIYEIYKNEKISVRSYNVCRYNGLDTIDKLKEYYLKNYSFEKLRNCGRRSSEELIEICKKYETSNSDYTAEQTSKNPLEEIIVNLTRIQREVINSFILVNTNSLSVRSKNAISIYLKNNFSVRNFSEKILLDQRFKTENIENIGKKSFPELEVYISFVKEFITDISEYEDEKQLLSLKNNFLIQRTFSISKIPIEVLESESIFKLVSFLINSNCFFSERDTAIVIDTIKIYNNFVGEKISVISLKYQLTKPRIEGIRKTAMNSMFDKLLIVKNFNDDLFQNYGIELSSNLIEVEENLISQINTLNKTNFSKEFASYILAVYLNDNFLIIGNIEDVLLPKFLKSRNRHNWNNFYIVNKGLSTINFEKMMNDVFNRVNSKIDETYSFNFKSYLSRFISDLDIEIIENAFPVAEKILNDEFALHLDLNDNIVFKRNTIKHAFEYAYEALEELGESSKVEEITKKIIELHPNYETDEKKVRASLKRNHGFVPIGRTSVFGLKKWENELDNFKGGTIRSITIEFLEKFVTPKHISSISEYISNFREGTYQRSIMDNLKADKSNSFIFLRQGFIGLNSLKEKYDIDKYQNLPAQFGKTIISLNRKGYSKQDIVHYIISNFNLNEEESFAIINNLEI